MSLPTCIIQVNPRAYKSEVITYCLYYLAEAGSRGTREAKSRPFREIPGFALPGFAQSRAKSRPAGRYPGVALPCFKGPADQYEYFQNCTAPKAARFPISPTVHCPGFQGQNWFTDQQVHVRKMHCLAGRPPGLISQDALPGPKKAYGPNG